MLHVTFSERFTDPIFRLGLLMTVVPFAVMAVPAELINRTSSVMEQRPGGEKSLSVPALRLQEVNRAGPQQPPAQVPSARESSPSHVPTAGLPSRPPAILRPVTPQDIYAAWLVDHPVVRDADLMAAGAAEGEVPRVVSVALRTQASLDLRDVGTPDGIVPSQSGSMGARLRNTVDLSKVEVKTVAREQSADVDLSKEGTPFGILPHKPLDIGPRLERVVDLGRAGSPPGEPPRIPTREDF